MTEMKRENGRLWAKCKCCGRWVDVTSLAEVCNMDHWLGCDKCEDDFMGSCYGGQVDLEREELRGATDHRGRP